jgi:predicted MFS family arabinose efflux permease
LLLPSVLRILQVYVAKKKPLPVRTAIALALAIAVVNGFARFAYALVLPAMREALSWDYAASGWLNTANSLGYALGGLSGMLLLRRVTSNRLFAIGLIGTVACIALVGATHALGWMMLWRFLAGVGAAWVFACGGALVAMRYSASPARAGSAIAVFYSGGGLGIALSGLVVAPVLSGTMSWQYAWYALGLAGAVLMLPPLWSALRIPSAAPQNTAQSGTHSGFEWRPFSRLFVAYFLFGLGYIVYLTFVIAWLKEMQLGVSWSVGLWVLMGLATMASSWLWRIPMTTWLPTHTYCAAACCTAIGSAIPILFRHPAALAASVVLVGASFFMVPSSIAAFSRRMLPQSLWATSMNAFTMVFALGQALGPVLAGWLADTAGMNMAMLFGALTLLCCAFFAQTQSAQLPERQV